MNAAPGDPISSFYEEHPYPPPVSDLDAFAARWDDPLRRRSEYHRLFPDQPYREDLRILVAGCGTSQAARQALKWPNASVVGIDVSASSLAATEQLRDRYELRNLQLRELPIEDVASLDGPFDLVVCTGVVHHLADPAAGLAALRQILAPGGALHLMVYGRHGRVGISMLREYCRILGIEPSEAQLDDLVETLREIPIDHPISRQLRGSPDFRRNDALADALLNPRERTYAVGELMDLLSEAGLGFGRWYRQAPYRPQCGAIATTPHAARLSALDDAEQFAAAELFRGTMATHSLVAHRDGDGAAYSAEGLSMDAVPIRLPDTVLVTDNIPQGYAAVAMNTSHKDTDLVLGIGEFELDVLEAIDGSRTIGEVLDAADVAGEPAKGAAELFMQRLWHWDQIVFDRSAEAQRA